MDTAKNGAKSLTMLTTGWEVNEKPKTLVINYIYLITIEIGKIHFNFVLI